MNNLMNALECFALSLKGGDRAAAFRSLSRVWLKDFLSGKVYSEPTAKRLTSSGRRKSLRELMEVAA